jgi:hypothetical protein
MFVLFGEPVAGRTRTLFRQRQICRMTMQTLKKKKPNIFAQKGHKPKANLFYSV